MTAQRGRDLLLKVDSTGSDNFITVAGLRANTLSFNSEVVDISAQDSQGAWKELLAGAGLKSAQIKGQGIFKNAASDTVIRSYFFNGAIVNWQIVIPAFGTLTGRFQIAALDFNARHDGEVSFDMSLVSAGALTFAQI